MTSNDEFLEGLFLGCASAAYVDQAAEQQGWPDPELTRRRAYRYYEQALNKRRSSNRP